MHSDASVPTWKVLREEFGHIHGAVLQQLDAAEHLAIMTELKPSLVGLAETERTEKIGKAIEEARYRKSVHGLPGAGQTALCLSGGGIRSAAFCLGVLQGLAQQKLLGQFHYLSTVSGGGYIGSWLTAWIHRADQQQGGASVEDNLAYPAELTTTPPEPLIELRRRQQYITPRAGLLSADTWAAVALLLRDLILNWLVFLPLILAALLLPRLLEWLLVFWGYFARETAMGGINGGSTFGYVYVVVTSIITGKGIPGDLSFGWKGLGDLTGAALVLLGLTRSMTQRLQKEPNSFNDFQYMVQVMLPILLGAFVLLMFLAPIIIRGTVPDHFMLWAWIFGTMLTFILARILAALKLGFRVASPGPGRWNVKGWENLGLECLALGGAGLTAGTLIWCALLWRVSMNLNATVGLRDLAAFGIPVLLLAYLTGQSIYAGLTSHSPFSTGDREWLARASGYYLLWALAWAIAASLVLFGGDVVEHGHAILVAGGTGAVTLGGAVSRFAKATTRAAAKEHIPVTKLTEICCLIFVAAGAIVLSYAMVRVLGCLWQPWLDEGPALAYAMQASIPGEFAVMASWIAGPIAGRMTAVAFGAAALCFGVSLLASLFVNVNTFSLHALYEARLVRAFLGASNVASVTGAKPVRNAFTDFCDSDNIRLSALKPRPRSPLFPVLGMTLNLVRPDNLAWQQRKAAAFVATPLRMGSDLVGYRAPADDMTLGKAMAISGAAASPNWGYHSSPLVGFVMMLFNIRLGQWLPNPKHKSLESWVRSFSLMCQEATGQTTDKQANIYISDGGHFDNLGLYEMLRRRCRTILVIDASQDEKMSLDDLGSTLRKAAIDLGVSVKFGPLGMARRSDPLAPGLYAGVGRIHYSESRYVKRGRAHGWLIYIKPGAYADVPADVRAYAASNVAFPHDSTTNQFFTEAQFESYRALGAHVVSSILGGSSQEPPILRLPVLTARYIRSIASSPTM